MRHPHISALVLAWLIVSLVSLPIAWATETPSGPADLCGETDQVCASEVPPMYLHTPHGGTVTFTAIGTATLATSDVVTDTDLGYQIAVSSPFAIKTDTTTNTYSVAYLRDHPTIVTTSTSTSTVSGTATVTNTLGAGQGLSLSDQGGTVTVATMGVAANPQINLEASIGCAGGNVCAYRTGTGSDTGTATSTAAPLRNNPTVVNTATGTALIPAPISTASQAATNTITASATASYMGTVTEVWTGTDLAAHTLTFVPQASDTGTITQTATQTATNSASATTTVTSTITSTASYFYVHNASYPAAYTQQNVGVGVAAPDAKLTVAADQPYAPALKLYGDPTGLASIVEGRLANGSWGFRVLGDGSYELGTRPLCDGCVGGIGARLSLHQLKFFGFPSGVTLGNGQQIIDDSNGGLNITSNAYVTISAGASSWAIYKAIHMNAAAGLTLSGDTRSLLEDPASASTGGFDFLVSRTGYESNRLTAKDGGQWVAYGPLGATVANRPPSWFGVQGQSDGYTYNGSYWGPTSDLAIRSSIFSDGLWHPALNIVGIRQSLVTGNSATSGIGFTTFDNSNGQGIDDAARIVVVNEHVDWRNSPVALDFFTNPSNPPNYTDRTTPAVRAMRLDSQGNEIVTGKVVGANALSCTGGITCNGGSTANLLGTATMTLNTSSLMPTASATNFASATHTHTVTDVRGAIAGTGNGTYLPKWDNGTPLSTACATSQTTSIFSDDSYDSGRSSFRGATVHGYLAATQPMTAPNMVYGVGGVNVYSGNGTATATGTSAQTLNGPTGFVVDGSGLMPTASATAFLPSTTTHVSGDAPASHTHTVTSIAGAVGGTGSANRVAVWADGTSLRNGVMTDNGTGVAAPGMSVRSLTVTSTGTYTGTQGPSAFPEGIFFKDAAGAQASIQVQGGTANSPIMNIAAPSVPNAQIFLNLPYTAEGCSYQHSTGWVCDGDVYAGGSIKGGNITPTPAPNKIPKADSDGTLDTWVTGNKVRSVGTQASGAVTASGSSTYTSVVAYSWTTGPTTAIAKVSVSGEFYVSYNGRCEFSLDIDGTLIRTRTSYNTGNGNLILEWNERRPISIEMTGFSLSANAPHVATLKMKPLDPTVCFVDNGQVEIFVTEYSQAQH